MTTIVDVGEQRLAMTRASFTLIVAPAINQPAESDWMLLLVLAFRFATRFYLKRATTTAVRRSSPMACTR